MPWDYNRENTLNPLRTTLPDTNDVGRRTAVIDFLKHLPDNRDERTRKLKFLERAQQWIGEGLAKNSEQGFEPIAKWLESISQLDASGREIQGEILSRPLQKFNAVQVDVPVYMLDSNTMTPQIRVIVWNEALDFLTILPKNLKYFQNFTEVLRWLNDLGYGGRKAALKLMYHLPQNEKERSDYVDYFDYWDFYPDELYAKGRSIFSIWFHVTDPTTMAICHGAVLFVMLLFTLGIFTRVTSVLTWVAALFYIHRCQYILFGMDTMMMILLFYLMIGPSGATLSIDRLLARFRASRAILKAAGKPVPWAEAILAGPVRSRSANFVLRLVQIHFCIMYMSSGLSKLKGTTWWDTTANWFTIANPEFSPIWFDAYDKVLHAVASIRPLFMIVLAGLNYYTLVLEIALPCLIWTRMRPYMVIGAILLHTGIAMTMGLSVFGLLMMTLLLCYIPASVIRERISWPRGSEPEVHLHFNSRNPNHLRN